MNHEPIEQFKHQLSMVHIGKALSDESAYELYQLAKVVFDWVTAECTPKFRRYLLNREGIQPIEKYNPKKHYEDFEDEILPF